MDPNPFIQGVKTLVTASPLFGDDELEAVLIYNPRAGGFSHRLRYHNALSVVAALDSQVRTPRRGKTGWRSIATTGSRHASRIASELLDEAAMRHGTSWFVILASGDGTSLEFLDILSRAPDELRERFVVLRLPMGTGNDGSDGRDLAGSLARIYPGGSIVSQRALRVIPAPGGPASKRAPEGEWRSFNIASVGLDAYVTHMTNRLKAFMPGDSYKLWLDLASVLYDKVYPVEEMELQVFGSNGKLFETRTEQYLLVAMGVSGYRTYGSNKPILPGIENVCTVLQMPLLRKLALKGPIAAGRHREFPEAALFSAEAMEIRYKAKLLVQMDGEAELLMPKDFPLRMELTGPSIRCIGKA